ncbi:MAG TPA: metal-dependent hydrolase [Burkholderiaceae bacterium]
MDTISQFALGAAVGAAVVGRRVGLARAALWGGVCGIAPDLDAFIDYGDPVSNMTQHRAETHALFWQTLASPPIAGALAWLHRARARPRDAFPGWLLAVWLVLVTHALLDATTIYGTQLGLPFTNHPYGLGSIFIIDPLYTLPLIAGLVLAARSGSPGRLRWNAAGLALSSAYLAWSAIAQWGVQEIVARDLAARGDPPPARVLVTPAPFNTLLWRVLVMRESSYDEGYYALADRGRPIRFERFALDPELLAQGRAVPALARIAWFSHGFFKVEDRGGVVVVSDLRMGTEPAYSFEFAVATRASTMRPIVPVSVGGLRGVDLPASLRWIARRIGGEDSPPPRAPRRH